jgi:hypothetical protein
LAISYGLAMATSMPVAQVARELNDAAQAVGLFDASVTPERVFGEGAVTGRGGTWIRVSEVRPQPWISVITTDLGFTPTVSVTFRLDKFRESSDQQDDMIWLVAGLLDRVPGDAVLHFEYEVIWLLRRRAT